MLTAVYSNLHFTPIMIEEMKYEAQSHSSETGIKHPQKNYNFSYCIKCSPNYLQLMHVEQTFGLFPLHSQSLG